MEGWIDERRDRWEVQLEDQSPKLVCNSGWFWVVLDGSEWFWVVLSGSGWFWVVLGGSGWFWMVLDGSGWF